jgi:hypothetical protein
MSPLALHVILLQRKIRSRSVDLGHGSPGVATSVPGDQRFFDPIKLPGRKPSVMLRDAADNIGQLPEAEHGLTQACSTGQGQGAAKAIAGCRLDDCCAGYGQGGPRGGVMCSTADMAGPAVGSTGSRMPRNEH